MSKFSIFIYIFILVIIDFFIKNLALNNLVPFETIYFLPFLNFYLTFNTGIAFSMFDFGSGLSSYILLFIGILIVIFLVKQLLNETNKIRDIQLKNKSVIKVNLFDRSYAIEIGSSLLNEFKFSELILGNDCLIVTNEIVAPIYLDTLINNIKTNNLETLILEDGESAKTEKTWSTIIDKLVDMKANRDTTILALGGGVIGDIVGFAAATYMRGLPFIQIPTSLLAQVDSSVGGKTGINHAEGKNLVGSFYQPIAVVSDIDVLKTLPDREYKCGLAEIIKYGAIYDSDFFVWLEGNFSLLLKRDNDALIYAISRSCKIKADIVSQDELETGKRAILNFGHTFAHAMENHIGYGTIFHGEAVAIGMLMASKISLISQSDQDRLKNLIINSGLPHKLEEFDKNEMLEIMLLDKKIKNKKLRLILLSKLGEAYIEDNIQNEHIMDALEKFHRA